MQRTKPCANCGTSMNTPTPYLCAKRKYCGDPCFRAAFRTPEAIATRFWAKVKKGDGCWIWQGARSVSKYGTANYKGTNMNAHRVAWIITHNDEVPAPGIDVLHTCNNGIGGCVRPDHLYLGTDLENARDRIKDGVHRTKLTVDQVRAIKSAPLSVMGKDLAKQYGVSDSTVCGIRRGEKWKWVQP